MKKWTALFVLSVFLAGLISAQSGNATLNASETARSFQESSNAFFENEVTVPSQLGIFAKILFGMKEGNTLELSSLIILFALWIIILLLIQSVLEIIPLFGEGWKSWLAAAIVTSLASISGGVKDAAVFIFDMRKLFGWLGNYSFLVIVLNIIILVFIVWGGKELLHMLKHKGKVEAAEMNELKG